MQGQKHKQKEVFLFTLHREDKDKEGPRHLLFATSSLIISLVVRTKRKSQKVLENHSMKDF